jgi:hypothetical protein
MSVIKPYHSDNKVGTSLVVYFGRCHEATMLSPIYHTPLLHPQLCQTLLARINNTIQSYYAKSARSRPVSGDTRVWKLDASANEVPVSQVSQVSQTPLR